MFTTADLVALLRAQPVRPVVRLALGRRRGATLQDLVLPRMRATAGATYVLGTTMVGLALGPVFRREDVGGDGTALPAASPGSTSSRRSPSLALWLARANRLAALEETQGRAGPRSPAKRSRAAITPQAIRAPELPRGVGAVIVRLRRERRSPRRPHRVAHWDLRPSGPAPLRSKSTRTTAVGADDQVRQITHCAPIGVVPAVLAARRVPVRPGTGKGRPLTAADGVQVDAVSAGRADPPPRHGGRQTAHRPAGPSHGPGSPRAHRQSRSGARQPADGGTGTQCDHPGGEYGMAQSHRSPPSAAAAPKRSRACRAARSPPRRAPDSEPAQAGVLDILDRIDVAQIDEQRPAPSSVPGAAKSSARNTSHSVTITTRVGTLGARHRRLSAEFDARASAAAPAPRLRDRSRAPSRRHPAAPGRSPSDGASRMSSVLGLKVRPSTRDRLARARRRRAPGRPCGPSRACARR